MKDFFDKTLFLYWLFHYKLFFDVWRQAEETPTIDLEVKKGSELKNRIGRSPNIKAEF